MKKWLLPLALPLVSLFADVTAIEQSVREYRLDNGLVLLVLPRHEAPVISCIIHAKVGSANEQKGFYGISHIFEHMAFKGTRDIGSRDFKQETAAMAREDSIFALILKEKASPLPDSAKLRTLEADFDRAKARAESLTVSEQFSRLIEQEGGVSLNAGTGYDGTTYFVRLPSNKLEFWMSLQSDQFLDPVLREYYTEVQGPIAEERRMRYDDQPTGKLMEQFLRTAFPDDHPYGHPIIGYMDDIMTMTRAKAETYFRTHYLPANLIIAIVGDVDPDRVFEMAKTYWGRLPRREPPPPPLVPVIAKGEKRIDLKLPSQPWLFLGFHRPSALDRPGPVYDALAGYIGRGRTSLLYEDLVKNKKIATSAFASSSFPGDKYSCLFWFGAVPTPGHTAADCERAIEAVLERVKRNPVPVEELNKIKARAKADIVRVLGSDLYTAMSLAISEDYYGDWREMFRELERLDTITPIELREIAQELFVPDNRVVGSIVTTEEEK